MFTTSSIINVITVVINICFTIYMAKYINKKISDDRYLKNLFIDKTLKLEEKYILFFLKVDKEFYPREVFPELKLLKMEASALINRLNKKYKIDNTDINKFMYEIRNLFDDTDEFNNAYSNNNLIRFSSQNQNKIREFQFKNIGVFMDIIEKINEYH